MYILKIRFVGNRIGNLKTGKVNLYSLEALPATRRMGAAYINDEVTTFDYHHFL